MIQGEHLHFSHDEYADRVAHIIAFDEAQGLAMTLGRTSVVGERRSEPLSRASLDLVAR